MTFFRDTEDLHEVLGGLFSRLAGYPPFASGVAKAGVTIRFHHRSPDGVITLLSEGEASFRWVRGEEGPEPIVRIRMEADVAHEFWLGRLNVPLALATGKIAVEGPTESLLGLVPALQGVHPIYRDLLASLGREGAP